MPPKLFNNNAVIKINNIDIAKRSFEQINVLQPSNNGRGNIFNTAIQIFIVTGETDKIVMFNILKITANKIENTGPKTAILASSHSEIRGNFLPILLCLSSFTL